MQIYVHGMASDFQSAQLFENNNIGTVVLRWNVRDTYRFSLQMVENLIVYESD